MNNVLDLHDTRPVLGSLAALGALAVTAAQAAKLCSISRPQWFALAARGRVPAPVNLGARCPRWRVEELRQWLRAGCPSRAAWQQIQELARSKRESQAIVSEPAAMEAAVGS